MLTACRTVHSLQEAGEGRGHRGCERVHVRPFCEFKSAIKKKEGGRKMHFLCRVLPHATTFAKLTVWCLFLPQKVSLFNVGGATLYVIKGPQRSFERLEWIYVTFVPRNIHFPGGKGLSDVPRSSRGFNEVSAQGWNDFCFSYLESLQ